jgi:acetyl-CoA synthetase
MSDADIVAIKPEIEAHALVSRAKYDAMTAQAGAAPEEFWAQECQRISWIKPPTRIKNTSFTGDVSIKWFEDGTLNASANCLDRHLAERAEQVAIIWEGDDPNSSKKVTYAELHAQVCKLANAMTTLGIKKGDVVTIYLPMVVEAAVALLACARIGAIHSVVFGGFSPDSLANRIQDCGSVALITADEGRRGGRKVALKVNADAALKSCPSVRHVIVAAVTAGEVEMVEGRDVWWNDICDPAPATHEPVEMNAEDPLFILYTSGSTGKPKGVLHTTGGYMVWASFTHQYVFDYHPGEVYWCTADVGWVTGHTYIVYGPLANGATTLMFEGIPNYPDTSRFWQVIDKHQVNIFYTAPTAIRALMRDGDGPVKKTSRKSLRVLGSVGEPINPEAWNWYYRVVGDERCPIVDTWWQTETGGILISPLVGAIAQKPGSATLPLPGVKPLLVDVINVSGHRMGTAEVESALVAHPKVAEAAVVGYPHDIKGQGIYAYVTLIAEAEPSEALRKELVGWVRKEIGPIAAPDVIQWAPGLPKTRSGKIMRRILRKIAANETDSLGDTSTLADPGVVTDLVDNRAA